MRCGFCQPVSEYASSLRNGRRPFRNDELHQTTNWKSLLTCVAPDGRGGIYAVWSFMLIKRQRPGDVFCVASHGAKVMAEYAGTVLPRGVIANDAGMGLDGSGADGLPVLAASGVPGETMSSDSARIGDALSTWNDGVISAVNRPAEARGVRVGMRSSEAARLMLGDR